MFDDTTKSLSSEIMRLRGEAWNEGYYTGLSVSGNPARAIKTLSLEVERLTHKINADCDQDYRGILEGLIRDLKDCPGSSSMVLDRLVETEKYLAD